MQKKLSRTAKQVNWLWHNVKANLKVASIIVLTTIILQLVSGCEPLNPDDDNKKKNSHETTPNEIVQKPEINDWEDD